MSAMTQNIPGANKSPDLNPSDSSVQRDVQAGVNDTIFSRLNDDYQMANRDCDFLSEALRMAETRRDVLGAALERLNASSSPSVLPSLR